MKTVLLLFCFSLVDVEGTDPCTDFIPLNEWKRSVANSDTSSLLCDSYLKDGWYRSISNAGNTMPTSCPDGGFRCGTADPIWLNGSHPSAGMANITACVADYKSCCSKSYQIQVKNCNGYFVYNLKKTIGCAQAYCFGEELPCPTGETSKNGFTPGCKYEPCLPVNHENIEEWKRSTSNNFTNELMCDSFLREGWYRPKSNAGNLMPTQCLHGGSTCGTVQPIWMQGNFPNNGETLNVTACAANIQNCCAHSYDIQVRNCSTFVIYKLVPTKGCAQAYCFGSEVPCRSGYTSDNGFSPGCTFDPCNELNYIVLKNQIKRSSNYTLTTNDEPYDDSTLSDGWYRIDSSTGNDIVNTPQPANQCGTKYPIWMQGNIPNVSEKTADRTVCLTSGQGICTLFNIKVRNCGTYRTYFLPRVNSQFAGYCFGTQPVLQQQSEMNDSDKVYLTFLIILPLVILFTLVFLWLKIIIKIKPSPKKVHTVPEKA